MKAEVCIIGGGAAGLMCAITAARRGRRVQVIEHARQVGRKILMSGGGRCNFTNLYVTPDNFLSANPHFCKSALARYTQWDFIALVEKHGIAYHEKEAGQLFCDESSKQIVRMLLAECAEAGVEIVTGCAVQAVQAADGGFRIDTARGPLDCQRLVIASGGLSIPKMGATGFAYELARQFGHELVETRAALVPFTLSGRPLQDWEGLAGVAHAVSASAGGMSFDGALLLTHRGLSGPAILQISSYWSPGEELLIDWLPGQDAALALAAVKRAQPALDLAGWLGGQMPRRLAQRLAELSGLPARPLGQQRDADLAALGRRLNAWSFRPSGTEGYRTAEVTLGGVSTEAVSSASMESALQPGLHFVGEALDVTGHLGGFNFQWAWASGHAAGQAL